MSETAAVMHYETQGATPKASEKRCSHCRAMFKPKRSWGRFCPGKPCKAEFHALRRAAPVLLEALHVARAQLASNSIAPDEAIDLALEKAKPKTRGVKG